MPHNTTLLFILAAFACAQPTAITQTPVTKPDIEPATVCAHMAVLFDKSSIPKDIAAKEKERCVPGFTEKLQEPCYEPFASCLLSKKALEEIVQCKAEQAICEKKEEDKAKRDKEEKRTAALCPKLEQLASKPLREPNRNPPGYIRKPFRKETCPRDANAEWGPFLIACAELSYDWEYYSYCKDKMIHPACTDFIDEVEQVCEDPTLPPEGKTLCKEPQEMADNLRGGSLPEPPGPDSDIFCKNDAVSVKLQQAKATLRK